MYERVKCIWDSGLHNLYMCWTYRRWADTRTDWGDSVGHVIENNYLAKRWAYCCVTQPHGYKSESPEISQLSETILVCSPSLLQRRVAVVPISVLFFTQCMGKSKHGCLLLNQPTPFSHLQSYLNLNAKGTAHRQTWKDGMTDRMRTNALVTQPWSRSTMDANKDTKSGKPCHLHGNMLYRCSSPLWLSVNRITPFHGSWSMWTCSSHLGGVHSKWIAFI